MPCNRRFAFRRALHWDDTGPFSMLHHKSLLHFFTSCRALFLSPILSYINGFDFHGNPVVPHRWSYKSSHHIVNGSSDIFSIPYLSLLGSSISPVRKVLFAVRLPYHSGSLPQPCCPQRQLLSPYLWTGYIKWRIKSHEYPFLWTCQHEMSQIWKSAPDSHLLQQWSDHNHHHNSL